MCSMSIGSWHDTQSLVVIDVVILRASFIMSVKIRHTCGESIVHTINRCIHGYCVLRTVSIVAYMDLSIIHHVNRCIHGYIVAYTVSVVACMDLI